MRWIAGLFVIAAGAAAPVAGASTISHTPGSPYVSYQAVAGETNTVTVTLDATGTILQLADSGITITNPAGSDCTVTGVGTATCPLVDSSEGYLSVTLGDGNDRLDASGLRWTAYGYGGAGDDTLTAAIGQYAVIYGEEGADELHGTLGASLYGGTGPDRLFAGALSTNFYPGAGDDHVTGGTEADYIYASAGADVVDGGGGFDYLSYSATTAGVTVSIDGVANDGATGEGDNATNVEYLIGGSGADTLVGDGRQNWLYGGPGADTLKGGGGYDYLSGDSGNDALDGGAGDDDLSGGTGADRLIGGVGEDSASYGGSQYDGVTVRLDGVANDGAPSEGDMVDVEDVYGSAGNDVLVGNGLANYLSGGRGNDKLTGAGGTDELYGGSGRDRLAGGAASDTFDGGTGGDLIDARDGRRDEVRCGGGLDRVRADAVDRIAGNC